MPGLYSNLKGLTIQVGHNQQAPALYRRASQLLAQQLEPHQNAQQAASCPYEKRSEKRGQQRCQERSQEPLEMTAANAKKPRLDAIQEKHVFFDVETNGLSKVCLAVQLSFLVTEIRRNKEGQAEISITDYFDGCFPVETMSPTAAKIHGITLEHIKTLADNGELNQWDTIAPRFLQHCEEADAMVGHNIAFDIRSIRDTLAYNNLTHISAGFAKLAAEKKNCTLQMSKTWTKPNGGADKANPSKPDSHKLTHMYSHIFQQDMSHAHDAAADTIATAALFYHLKSESIDPRSTISRVSKPKLSEPAEVHNTSTNSIPWLVMESNHDRRHIIPKSLLRLFIQHGIENFGIQRVAQTCLQHQDFPIMAQAGLNPAAIAQLHHISSGHTNTGAPESETKQEIQDILYLLLKHNRFNYFLGESSWNRAIGAPMRFLRSQEPAILKALETSQTFNEIEGIVNIVFTNIEKCLDATHPRTEWNVSFEDTRGGDILKEGKDVLANLKESLSQIQRATLDALKDPEKTSLSRAQYSSSQMVKHLQDSFSFDSSQSWESDVRTTQNSNLSRIYGELNQSIHSKDPADFTNAFNHFLDLSALFIDQGTIQESALYSRWR